MFDDQNGPLTNLSSTPICSENFGVLDYLGEEHTHTSTSICSCALDGGTPPTDFLLQCEEPISVSLTEGVQRVENLEVRTPTPSYQSTITGSESVLREERFVESIDIVSPRSSRSPSDTPVFSLSSLRQEPLYLFNQRHRRKVNDKGSLKDSRSLASIVAEFDGLFDNAVPTKPEDFTFKVHGTPDFILKVNTLNRKYDVFSTSVRAEPADVTPMEVNVDLNMWNKPANAGPPRKQSLVKEKAIIGQVTPLLSSRVIQPSTQPYYSQVHMVPKVTSPTEPADFRSCVDLRGLDNCTENISWPLPNIPAMLTQIGQQKPKLFAERDLTSGYHQSPLHENSWIFFLRSFASLAYMNGSDALWEVRGLVPTSRKRWRWKSWSDLSTSY